MFTISFQPRRDSDLQLMPQVLRGEFSSGHPAMQQINPHVAAIWITYSQAPAHDEDALLDAVVFSTAGIQPAVYPMPLRAELEQYVQRTAAYQPKLPLPTEADMARIAQIYHERRFAGISAHPDAASLAAEYVEDLRPCYEWEGFHDCPEREAKFADDYQATHPDGPFSAYLPLLSAHRWLCTTEAYVYEGKPQEAERARRLHVDRLAIARQSSSLLVRTAAEYLAKRGKCHSSR